MSDRQTERWTFGGTRISTKGKRLHLWLDVNGERLLYKASGSHVVGAIYEVEISRDDTSVLRYGEPTYTGDRNDDDDLVDELAANHRASNEALNLASRERSAKAEDPVELAIARLCELAGKIPPSQRTAFNAYVLTRLTRSW